MNTTTAGTILSALTTDIGTILAAGLPTIITILAALIGLGFLIVRVKKWIGRKA